MKEITLDRPQGFKHKKPIAVLTIISAVFAFVGIMDYFVDYEQVRYGFDLYTVPCFVVPVWGYELQYIIQSVLLVIAMALFAVYILKFPGTEKIKCIAPVVFGLEAIWMLSETMYIVFDYGFFIGFYSTPIRNLLYIILAILFVLVATNAVKKFSEKFLVIAVAIGILLEAFGYYDSIGYLFICVEEGHFLKLLLWLISIVGHFLFYIALIWFGLTNTIPPMSSATSKKKEIENISPEQALRTLKEKLDNGMITEEEYTAQRATIISKL